jgi:hypothetical protein
LGGFIKNFKLNYYILYVFLFAAPVVLFFQNCGQPGSLQMQASEETGQKIVADETADTFIIDPDSVDSEGGALEGCKGLVISDFQLNSLSINSDLQIVDQDLTISLEKPTLKVKALRNGTLKHIFLMLNSEGNKVLTSNEQVLALKTPSAQSAGLKIHLLGKVSIEADKHYLLKLDINPEEQIVSNPEKCIFKPVVKGAELLAE